MERFSGEIGREVSSTSISDIQGAIADTVETKPHEVEGYDAVGVHLANIRRKLAAGLYKPGSPDPKHYARLVREEKRLADKSGNHLPYTRNVPSWLPKP